MIDIIIPAYNAHKTITETLANIAIQTIKDKIIVYIVDDQSNKNYDKEIALFKDDLKIVYLKTDKNGGPGYARQYAIDKSNSPYIVFMDADDQFYNAFSLSILYSEIKTNKLDLVIGLEIIENKGINKYNDGSLHGKIYRRSHIIKNKIRFNNSRYSEDNSYHNLVMNTTTKYKYIDKITYIYRFNNESVTNTKNKNNHILNGFIDNMVWLINELEKRNVDVNIIVNLLIYKYIYIYDQINTNSKIDVNEIYKHCYYFEKIFQRYSDYISDSKLSNCLSKYFGTHKIYKDYALYDFYKFREKNALEGAKQ